MSDPEPAATFSALHESGCFTMPNAWDAGSARLLASHGFRALGTTSAGLAYRLGIRDAAGRLPLDTVLDNVREIADAVDVPVSADFENGYADAPESVAAHVRRCAEAGASGCSIEDWDGTAFYSRELALERVSAAVEAAEALGTGFVITARAEQLVHDGPGGLEEAVERLQRFAAAGAHCVYAPGLRDEETIQSVAASAGAPLNVLVGMAGMHATTTRMTELGVRRLSVGGSLVRVALAAVDRAAAEMAGGRFEFPDHAIADPDLMARYAAGQGQGPA
jgi:2-methylisocitrate lyase-like PEP mutase family enzyme